MPDAVNRAPGPQVDAGQGPRLPWAPRCLGCGAEGQPRLDLCVACRAHLPWLGSACRRCALPLGRRHAGGCCPACARNPPPFGHAAAAFVYAPPLDRWLPRFKFHRDLAAGRLLAQLMAEALAAAERPEALVPVPLHRARLRRRGYDQALELARPLARALSVPLQAGLLWRKRATSPQSELAGAARGRNLRDAFAVRDRCALPAHVALVDDVMTTGATLQAAALALRAAGVARVDAWVCARVP